LTVCNQTRSTECEDLTFSEWFVGWPDHQVAKGRGCESLGAVRQEDWLAVLSHGLVEVLVTQGWGKVLNVPLQVLLYISGTCVIMPTTKLLYILY